MREADSDAETLRLLQEFDFYILPVVNPDGYSYTFTHVRFFLHNQTHGSTRFD